MINKNGNYRVLLGKTKNRLATFFEVSIAEKYPNFALNINGIFIIIFQIKTPLYFYG